MTPFLDLFHWEIKATGAFVAKRIPESKIKKLNSMGSSNIGFVPYTEHSWASIISDARGLPMNDNFEDRKMIDSAMRKPGWLLIKQRNSMFSNLYTN